jgi:hypothetical protein
MSNGWVSLEWKSRYRKELADCKKDLECGQLSPKRCCSGKHRGGYIYEEGSGYVECMVA